MSTLTIPAGAHGDGSLPRPWFWRIPNQKRWIRFHENCRYPLPAYNQKDVNKLYGLSYGFSEDNSARFGWRWSEEKQGIELLAYCHLGGLLNRGPDFDFPVLATVRPGEMVETDIRNVGNAYLFLVWQQGQLVQHAVPHGRIPTSYGVTRGFWFGGGLPAPHEVSVEITSNPF